MNYIIVAILLILSFPVNSLVSSSRHANKWWANIAYLVPMPGVGLALLLLAICSIPYFFLYPERHAQIFDVIGTDDQKLALKMYRNESAKRGFCQRVIENLGLKKHSGPEWPDILNETPGEDESIVT